MFSYRLVWVLAFNLLIALFCRAGEIETSALFDPAKADQLLLVAFSDSHIDRIQHTASPTVYRRRGPYKSSTWSQRVSAQIEADYGVRMLSEWPMTEIGLHCVVYEVPAGLSVPAAMDLLHQDPRVVIVQRMHQFKTEGRLYNDPYYPLQVNLHEMDIEHAHRRATGKAVTIAVIDTGVDMDHPDLIGQFEFSENYVSKLSRGFKNDLHGTAVSGVMVARKDNQAGIIGVAPDAKVIAQKACWPSRPGSFAAICNTFTLALALNTAIRSDVDVLNMSLAGPKDGLLEKLLARAIAKGILVVAADPGAKEPENRFPATLDGVIGVRVREKDAKASSDGTAINASGDHILTTLPYGTYDFVSGSSLAAAQVSGLLALMLELDPELSANQASAILRRANERSEPGKSGSFPIALNADAAIQTLCKAIRCPAK